ncbi:MAG: hypothetical protein WC335_07265 [Candidatus Omnitrophota bacterium]
MSKPLWWDPAIDLDGSGVLDGCVVFDDDRAGRGTAKCLLLPPENW